MLSELLEKKAKIGSVESIAYIAYWLSTGTNSIDDMVKCVQGHPNAKISEVKPILGLFEIMCLITFNGNTICCSDIICKTTDTDEFIEWFTPEYISFILKQKIINLEGISYSISKKKYILSSHAINPRKHACYRNLLIDLDIICYNTDGTYTINKLLDTAIFRLRKKKISEAELLDNLERQRVQGEIGEEFILNYEKERITNPDLSKKIERISLIDVAAGFDIVSFENNNSSTYDRYIEVKTFIGKPHFYWSKNEIEKARLIGDSYYLYLVDLDKISITGYKPECIPNPINLILQNTDWRKTTESILVELTNNKSNYSKTSNSELDGNLNQLTNIEELVNTAIDLGDEHIKAFENILNLANNKHNGLYQKYLALLKNKL